MIISLVLKESALSRKPNGIVPAMTLFMPGDCHSEALMVQVGIGPDALVLLCSSILQKHPAFPSDSVCCYLRPTLDSVRFFQSLVTFPALLGSLLLLPQPPLAK